MYIVNHVFIQVTILSLVTYDNMVHDFGYPYNNTVVFLWTPAGAMPKLYLVYSVYMYT